MSGHGGDSRCRQSFQVTGRHGSIKPVVQADLSEPLRTMSADRLPGELAA